MNPGQTMSIQSLKSNLIGIMPVLDANLAAAHSEYMAGDIPAGAFHYVRSRHLTACAVVSRDDLEAVDAYKACALLAIDLRTGIKELTESVKDQVDAWWQCYRDAGFTELHPFFEAPMLPSTPIN
uniref:Uncharacterized protein n=1 Tax=Pseudomonas fluorescens (strain SBW25) TaxID=216595 RepID=A4V6V7_PSEFS|nr:hypothetical protein [Pseudomonas fluorescens]CAM96268.1 hypothetical protein pQBR0236 [Pseudomonas fluorescens SBW25]